MDKITYPVGGEAIITVVINNDNIIRTLSLQETVPVGWSLTRISDDAFSFKSITNEWFWKV